MSLGRFSSLFICRATCMFLNSPRTHCPAVWNAWYRSVLSLNSDASWHPVLYWRRTFPLSLEVLFQPVLTSKNPVHPPHFFPASRSANVVSHKKSYTRVVVRCPSEGMMKKPTALAPSAKKIQVVAPIGFGSEDPYRLTLGTFSDIFVFYRNETVLLCPCITVAFKKCKRCVL